MNIHNNNGLIVFVYIESSFIALESTLIAVWCQWFWQLPELPILRDSQQGRRDRSVPTLDQPLICPVVIFPNGYVDTLVKLDVPGFRRQGLSAACGQRRHVPM